MSQETEIRAFQQGDLDAIVEFSLRAWEPVHASMRTLLPGARYLKLLG